MTWAKTSLVPDEVWGIVFPMLQSWQHLVPVWCESVRVYWVEDDGASMSIKVREDQRDAEIYIHPNWMTFPEMRERTVVHELCHFYNVPLTNLAKDCIGAFFPGDETPGTRIANEQLDTICERQNNDLVALVMRLSGG